MRLRRVRARESRPARDRRAPAASIIGNVGELAISAAVTRAALLGGVWLGALAMLAPNAAHAQDATWTGSASGNWNDNFNWSPAVPAGTATFDNTALTTSLTFSSFTEIDALQFTTTAPAYFYDLSGRALVILGAGILNSSSNAPTFNAFGLLEFDNAATAGNAIINNTPGATTFTGTSTAGTATITNSFGGLLSFTDSSTAGSASITTNLGSQTRFSANSTAGNATIIVNSGALTQFFDNSTAANGGGVFDMSGLTGAGMTAGSIEGAGSYALGAKQLTVGGNTLSTQVSGVIADGGISGGTGGSLVKVGAGTLTLSGANTYSGATTVNAGTLSVNGSIVNSALTVNAGGTIGGNGIVGNTTLNGGTLSPGNSIGTLTVQGNLVMTSAAAYIVEVSPTNADRTDVTGTASLGGTVQAVFGPGS